MELYTVEVLKVRIDLDTYLSSYELLDTVFIEEGLSMQEVDHTMDFLLDLYHGKESLKPLFETGSQVLNVVQVSGEDFVSEEGLDIYRAHITYLLEKNRVGGGV